MSETGYMGIKKCSERMSDVDGKTWLSKTIVLTIVICTMSVTKAATGWAVSICLCNHCKKTPVILIKDTCESLYAFVFYMNSGSQ